MKPNERRGVKWIVSITVVILIIIIVYSYFLGH
jgi:hypothetical protein